MPLRLPTALLIACGWAAGSLSGAEAPPLARYDRAEVAPAKTSIYIGTVTLTLPPLARRDGAYETAYTAKVFPYFFSNESGRLRIDAGDDLLRRLARGETVEFTGRAVRTDGKERRVEGRAVPTDAASGKIKVRVHVPPRIELIFNTTYRFPDVPAAP